MKFKKLISKKGYIFTYEAISVAFIFLGIIYTGYFAYTHNFLTFIEEKHDIQEVQKAHLKTDVMFRKAELAGSGFNDNYKKFLEEVCGRYWGTDKKMVGTFSPYENVSDMGGFVGKYNESYYGNNLPYWIEPISDMNYKIWVKVPNIPANGSVNLIIKKTPGYSPNGDAVFEFFDDFEGTDLDMVKWTPENGANWIVNNGVIESNPTNTYEVKPLLINNLQFDNVIIKARGRWAHTNDDLGIIVYGNNNADKIYTLWHEHGQPLDSHYSLTRNLDYQMPTAISSIENYYLQQNEWGNFKVLIKNNKEVYGKIWKWGTNEPDWTVSSTVTPYGKYAGIFYWNNNSFIEFDYIFIRKYAEQDPTVSMERISTDTWKITLKNPNNYDLTDFQVGINGVASKKDESILLTPNSELFYSTENIKGSMLEKNFPNIVNIYVKTRNLLTAIGTYKSTQSFNEVLKDNDALYFKIKNSSWNYEDIEQNPIPTIFINANQTTTATLTINGVPMVLNLNGTPKTLDIETTNLIETYGVNEIKLLNTEPKANVILSIRYNYNTPIYVAKLRPINISAYTEYN